MIETDVEEFDSCLCEDCDEWFDENYIEVCGICDAYVCPPCGKAHKCVNLID